MRRWFVWAACGVVTVSMGVSGAAEAKGGGGGGTKKAPAAQKGDAKKKPRTASASHDKPKVEKTEKAAPEKPAEKPAEKAPEKEAVVAPVSMLDCLSRANEKDPKCASGKAGTIGSGPKFSGGLTTAVRHGFVKGNQLILAVELSGGDDEYGGIFSVDLTTGNRALVSGKMNDPLNGEVSRGTSPPGKSLNQVRDVAPGPNNTWVAFANQGLQSNRLLFSINPSTGDRTVLFDSADMACAGIAGRNVMFDPSSGIAVGPDGAVYVALNSMPQDSGKGIAKIVGGKCSVVSLSGASTAANNKGSGPTVMGTFLYNLTYRDNALYMLQFNTHPSIMKIDPATGNRSIVSSADKGEGHDLNTSSMAIAPNGTFWTYHGYTSGFSGLISVDPVSGNRTVSEPKGGPVKRTQGPETGVWVHPDGKHLLTQYGNEIHIYDPATGNSNVLSY